MIQLLSLAFGPFAEVEPLNPSFTPGHSKLRLVVDAEPHPDVPDDQLLENLEQSFPGIEAHRCRDRNGDANPGDTEWGVILLENESTANQAHLLEHLLLEFLSLAGHGSRLSGVTCAYESPPHRNDVFVECREAGAGRLLAVIAVDALNAALDRRCLSPLYPDAVRSAREVLGPEPRRGWYPADLAPRAEIPSPRAASVLELFERAGAVEPDPYAMNFSGEPFYRLIESY